MPLPPLIRRRNLWVPTWPGFVVACAMVIALGAALVAFLYPFLASNNPVGARVLVVEGWMMPAQLDAAAQAYRNGAYARVYTTGGPIVHWPGDARYASAAERAARYLEARGVPPEVLVAVPTAELAAHRTYQSALAVRGRIGAEGGPVSAIDVVSAGPHARRSRLLYKLAFGPGSAVGILAAAPADYDPRAWWRSSAGVKEVVGELLSLLWVALFFWPDGRLSG